MMRSLDRLIKFIGVALIPIGAVLIWKQHWVLDLSMKDTVDATVAALIGMIPEGLYLLTSVALAVSMMRLARRKVLTRDMNCIETLARVDTLCVDKTGTITESIMQADDPLPLAENTPITEILSAFYAGGQPDNDTARALTAASGRAARHGLPCAPSRSTRRTSTVPKTLVRRVLRRRCARRAGGQQGGGACRQADPAAGPAAAAAAGKI